MSMKERAKFGVKIDLKKMLKGANTKLDQENSVDVNNLFSKCMNELITKRLYCNKSYQGLACIYYYA